MWQWRGSRCRISWKGDPVRYWVIAPYDSTQPQVFQTAWDWDLENSTIAVGWRQLGDISNLTREQLDRKYAETLAGRPKNVATKDCNALWRFYHDTTPGDIVIARRGRRRIAGIGQVSGSAFYDEQRGRVRVGSLTEDFYPNFLPVSWRQGADREFEDQVFGFFTIYEISEEKYRVLAGAAPLAATTSGDAGPLSPPPDVTEFALEKHLENFIVENFEKVFGGKLALYTDSEGNSGQQYPTVSPDGKEIGYIDILALDRATSEFLVIELKKGRESDKVVGQTLRYIGWVKENLCQNGEGVRGLIICSTADTRLRYAVKPIAELIDVKLYRIDFQLIEP